jgi:hypothetical protein
MMAAQKPTPKPVEPERFNAGKGDGEVKRNEATDRMDYVLDGQLVLSSCEIGGDGQNAAVKRAQRDGNGHTAKSWPGYGDGTE